MIALSESSLVARYLTLRGESPRNMLDIGAHRGSTLRPFLKRAFAIAAIEPNPDLVSHLVRTFGDREVKVLPFAVHPSMSGTVKLHLLPESDGGSSLLKPKNGHIEGRTVDVSCMTVQELVQGLQQTQFGAIKVDTEGLDADVVHCLIQENVMADAWIWEWHKQDEEREYITNQLLLEFFRQQGFEVFTSQWWREGKPGQMHVWRSLRKVKPSDSPDVHGWGNYIALREPHLWSVWAVSLWIEIGIGIVRFVVRELRRLFRIFS